MDKEAVLAKSRENSMDEREAQMTGNSLGFGLITVLLLVAVFAIWKSIHGVPFNELISISTGYIAASSFYMHKHNVKYSKLYLITGIMGTLATAASMVIFFLGV